MKSFRCKLAKGEVKKKKKKARCDLNLILYLPSAFLLALSWLRLAIKVYAKLCYITRSSAEIQSCSVRVSWVSQLLKERQYCSTGVKFLTM